MTTVAIRVDATPEIGFGHLERMIELGAALAAENHRPVFVTRAKSAGLDRLKARGIERIVEVPEKAAAGGQAVPSASCDILSPPRTLAPARPPAPGMALLGGADLAGETDAILSAGPGFVVLDIGHTSHELVAALKTPGCYVVSFEDLGEGRYLADIVVDANLTEASNPLKIVTPTRFLLGPSYAAVSRACRAARKRRRKIGSLKNVLVSAGGSDPAGVTAGVVTGLSTLSTEIDVEIVLGPAFAGQKALDKALLGAARTFSIAEAPADFAERLRAADLGILSGGVTLFEAAHLGLPAIVIAQNAAQLRNLPPFEAAGGIVSLGLAANKPYGNLVAALRELGVESKRRAMAASLEEFVDGEGISRIVVAIREMLGR